MQYQAPCSYSDILSWKNTPKNALVLNLRQMSGGRWIEVLIKVDC